MMIGHHHVLFYYTTIYYLPGISVSLALYPHNVNKFVLIVSNFYVAKVLSQQKAESHWLIYRHNRKEQSNKWGDKAHLRIIAPLPSGGNIAKTKPATGNR